MATNSIPGWESVDGGRWNRLRLSATSETELIIRTRGVGRRFEVTLCGRVLGATTDRDEGKRRQKALKMLRAWIDECESIAFGVGQREWSPSDLHSDGLP